MQTTSTRALAAALTLALAGCQRGAAPAAPPVEQETTEEDEVTTKTTQCDTPLPITLPPPDAAHPEWTASFEVDATPQPEPGLPCQRVRLGDEERDSQGGEVFTIAAHPTELQRLQIGNTTLLLHVPPGTRVRIGSHPCFGWQFLSPALDVESAGEAHATCAREGEGCPDGQLATSTRLASDPLCPEELDEAATQRCVAPTRVWLAPPSAWTKPVTYKEVGAVGEPGAALPGPLMPPLELLPRSCGFGLVDTGAERVALAVGFGQTWRLRVDPSGKLSGSIEEGS